MASEVAVDRMNRGINFDIIVSEKFMYKYAKEGESFSKALERIITGLVKDVKLPVSKLREIEARIAKNREKRMAKREEKARAARMG